MFQFATKFSPGRKKIRRAWKAGFEAGEIALKKKHLERSEGVIENANLFGLRHVLHFPNREKLKPRHLRAFVRIYEALECPAAVIHQPMLDVYGEKLKELAEGSLVLAVENGREVGAAFRDWATRSEFLTLDLEHLWKNTLADCPFPRFEEFFDRFMAEFGSKVRHIHMPGYLPGSREHCPTYTNPELACSVWERLRRLDYRGFVVSELHPELRTADHLRKDILLFEQWKSQVEGPPSVGKVSPR